jgi:hypothetical protein
MNPLVTYVSSDDEDDASSPKQLPAPVSDDMFAIFPICTDHHHD